MYAYCYRTGLVCFGEKIPNGAIEIAQGKGKKFINSIKVKCRLAYNNKDWIVPGIPEATTSDEAVMALCKFIKLIENGSPQ